jgi:hypothetical protein
MIFARHNLPRYAQVRVSLLLLAAGTAMSALAQSGPKPLSSPSGTVPATTNAHFKQVAPGVFQLGEVKLNRNEKTVAFPAVINLQKGPVEYLLVGAQGKIHESVLRTAAEPYHIHLGMLLLNAKGTPKGSPVDDYSKPVPGDAIAVSVSWQQAGKQRQAAGEDLVFDRKTQVAMSKGEWTYTGSRVIDGTFLAQRDRSMIAIIGDIDALVNNPRARRDQDENWLVNTKDCPELGTPVTVTLRLLPPKKAE